jgi:hypothetical protein
MYKFAPLFIFLFSISQLVLSGQDIIYYKDGNREEVRVTLVSDNEIQFRKFTNPDGPDYAIRKDKILLITYENGEYEMFNIVLTDREKTKKELAENFARNLLGYHLLDIVYGDITISYERILSSGNVGIKFPIGFGYAYNTDYYYNTSEWVKNLIYGGIGVNLYPTGQGKWRYFVGPVVRIGYGKQSAWDSYPYEENDDDEGIYTKFLVDNGIIFTPVRSLSISALFGIGVRLFPNASSSSDKLLPTGYFSTNLYYRF